MTSEQRPRIPGGRQEARNVVGFSAAAKLEENEWFQIGRRSAAAYQRRDKWLYRRVESIEFVGRIWLRRRVSVDLEVPAGLPSLGRRGAIGVRWVPISMLPKWPPLVEFSLIDANGSAASLVTSQTNKALDFGLVVGLAEEAGAKIGPVLRERIAQIVCAEDTGQHGVAQIEPALLDELARDQTNGILGQDLSHLVDLIEQLGDHKCLWAPVVGSPGSDRIIKFSYLDIHSELRDPSPRYAWADRVLTTCSWREQTVTIQLRHAGLHTRYHLDLSAPCDGLEFTRVQSFALPAAPQRRPRRRNKTAEEGPTGRHQRPSRKGLRALCETVRTTFFPVHHPESEPGLKEKVRHTDSLRTPGPESAESADARIGTGRSGAQDQRSGIELESVQMERSVIEKSSLSASGHESEGTAERTARDSAAEPYESVAHNDCSSDSGAFPAPFVADHRAHVYFRVREVPSHRQFLHVRVAPARSGFVTQALIAATLIAGLMTFGYCRLPHLVAHLDSTVVLLGAVPAILAVLLSRTGQHAMERYHLAGVRSLVFLAGAIPTTATLFLLANGISTKAAPLAPPPVPPLAHIWAVLLIISWLLACALGLSWIFAVGAKAQGNRDRRWARFVPAAGTFSGLSLMAGLLDASPYRVPSTGGQLVVSELLSHHVGLRLGASFVMGLSCIPLVIFVGGIWRDIDEIVPDRLAWARQAGAIIVCGTGFAWALSTLVALCGASWLVLTVHTHDAATLSSVSEVINAILHATVWPSAVFVTTASVGLAWKGALVPIMKGSIFASNGRLQAVAIAVGLAGSLVMWCRAAGVWPVSDPGTLPVILGCWTVLTANLCRWATGADERRIA